MGLAGGGVWLLIVLDQAIKRDPKGCRATEVAALPLRVEPGDVIGMEHEAQGDVLRHGLHEYPPTLRPLATGSQWIAPVGACKPASGGI